MGLHKGALAHRTPNSAHESSLLSTSNVIRFEIVAGFHERTCLIPQVPCRAAAADTPLQGPLPSAGYPSKKGPPPKAFGPRCLDKPCLCMYGGFTNKVAFDTLCA